MKDASERIENLRQRLQMISKMLETALTDLDSMSTQTKNNQKKSNDEAVQRAKSEVDADEFDAQS